MPKHMNRRDILKGSAVMSFGMMVGKNGAGAVDENPFPVSMEITVAAGYQSPQALDEFRAELVALDGVEGVQYSREWMRILKKIRMWFTWGTAAIVPFLILALHFMIANTIKLTIYARRDLVRNMRFVGATDLYIKMPFVLEGMLQGLVGAILGAIGLACLGGVRCQPRRAAWGRCLPVPPASHAARLPGYGLAMR